MKLLWHIVKKDLRHLRWLLAGWLVVIGLQVLLGVWMRIGNDPWARDLVHSMNYVLLDLQLFMALFLTAELIQEDSLVDPAAHWLTLPISGGQMLVTKLAALILFVWFLPAVALWPWWLSNHWQASDFALGTLVVVIVHVLVTLPALMIATMTNHWSRFLTWMLVFAVAVAVGWMSLTVQYESIAPDLRPSVTLNVSRVIAGIMTLAVLIAVVAANQYLSRRLSRSIVAVAIGSAAIALVLNCWPADFVGRVAEALAPKPLPLTQLSLEMGPITGSTPRPRPQDTVKSVGFQVAGTVRGLAPEDYIAGRLVEPEWRWGKGMFRVRTGKQFTYDFSSVRREIGLNPPSRSSVLFPLRDRLYSFGRPLLPVYAVRRMLAEPSQFKARLEALVIHREIVSEVPPRVGVGFGRGSDRMRIVSAERREDDLFLTTVRSFPLWGELNWDSFSFYHFRSVVFFNRSDREIIETLGRTSTQSTVSNLSLGPIGGVLLDRTVYRVHSPKEYFPDKPSGERFGPSDPEWFDGISVIWTEDRPVARFETEIFEPNFVVQNLPDWVSPPPKR